MNQGWSCPKCHAVMSPTYPSCINCKGEKYGYYYGDLGPPLIQTPDTLSLCQHGFPIKFNNCAECFINKK